MVLRTACLHCGYEAVRPVEIVSVRAKFLGVCEISRFECVGMIGYGSMAQDARVNGV